MFPEDFMEPTEKDLVKEVRLGNGLVLQIRKSVEYTETVTGERIPVDGPNWPY